MAVLNLDTSQRLDIICRKGDTFEFSFDVGDSFSTLFGNWDMEVRPTEDDDETTAVLSASASNLSGGVMTITITHTDMASVVAGLYVYDLQFKESGTGVTKTVMHGTFQINDDITTV